MESSCHYKDYQDKFDPYLYLTNYVTASNSQHLFRCYHQAFQSLPGGISVLDYGSGPSVRGTVSAAGKASEIILADFSATNRRALHDWIEEKDGAFDWSSHFRYVVKELEGREEDEVVRRQQQVRKVIKAVVPCDLTQDPPIEDRYNKTYDVVMTTFVVETIAVSSEHYSSLIGRMVKLVKPGGCFLFYGVENSKFITVGEHTFKDFPATTTMAVDAIKKCGFANIELDKTVSTLPTRKTYMFIKAT